MEKVAILNDIHGNYYLLTKVLDYCKDMNISKFLVCGDFLTDGPDDNKIIDTLRSLNAEVILGNREESVLNITPSMSSENEKYYPLYYTRKNLTEENLEYLKKLPTSKIVTINNKKILLSHGSPYNTKDIINQTSMSTFNKLLNDYDADIFLFAHTHKYFYKEYKNHLFINTGAINTFLGKPSTSTFGILSINEDITIYEQIEIPFIFDEVKNYYQSSKYYEECPEWSNIILYILKTGIDYNKKFTKSYDLNKSMKSNYYKFTFIYNLPKIYAN